MHTWGLLNFFWVNLWDRSKLSMDPVRTYYMIVNQIYQKSSKMNPWRWNLNFIPDDGILQRNIIETIKTKETSRNIRFVMAYFATKEKERKCFFSSFQCLVLLDKVINAVFLAIAKRLTLNRLLDLTLNRLLGSF